MRAFRLSCFMYFSSALQEPEQSVGRTLTGTGSAARNECDAPIGPDGLLAPDVPDFKVEPVPCERLDVEALQQGERPSVCVGVWAG